MMDHYFDTVMLHDCCMVQYWERKSRRMKFYELKMVGDRKGLIIRCLQMRMVKSLHKKLSGRNPI